MEQVKFHFDPRCPWCYQTSRWAVRLEELGEIAITRDGLILLEGRDQMIERFHRQLVTRGGIPQRHEHRVPRFARIHRVQFSAPPGQQPEALLGISDFVAQVVRPAAERIDVIKILMQSLRQQEADHLKVFVVMRGKPARVIQRFARVPCAFPRFRRLQELDGLKEHGARE